MSRMADLWNYPGLRELGREFSTALCAMCERHGWDPNAILAVMSNESGLNPAARNSIGATGLIQFMPATAKGIGTSVDALRTMSATEQLRYVERFFAGALARTPSPVLGDYYMACFLPGYVGKPTDFVLARKGQPIYDQNRGLDSDKNGVLTVGDVHAAIAAAEKRGASRGNAWPDESDTMPDTPEQLALSRAVQTLNLTMLELKKSVDTLIGVVGGIVELARKIEAEKPKAAE